MSIFLRYVWKQHMEDYVTAAIIYTSLFALFLLLLGWLFAESNAIIADITKNVISICTVAIAVSIVITLFRAYLTRRADVEIAQLQAERAFRINVDRLYVSIGKGRKATSEINNVLRTAYVLNVMFGMSTNSLNSYLKHPEVNRPEITHKLNLRGSGNELRLTGVDGRHNWFDIQVSEVI